MQAPVSRTCRHAAPNLHGNNISTMGPPEERLLGATLAGNQLGGRLSRRGYHGCVLKAVCRSVGHCVQWWLLSGAWFFCSAFHQEQSIS